jgi:hypothetical protein
LTCGLAGSGLSFGERIILAPNILPAIKNKFKMHFVQWSLEMFLVTLINFNCSFKKLLEVL